MMQYLETISSSKAKDFQTKYFYKIKAKDPKEYEPFPRSLDVFLVTAQDEDLILIIADSIDFQVIIEMNIF
jgi:hypothetical protein